MKRKNLEKTIVLGLMLGCVYSTAWAAPVANDDGSNITLGEIGNPATATLTGGNWPIAIKNITEDTTYNNITLIADGTYDGQIVGGGTPSVTVLQVSSEVEDTKFNINGDLYIDATTGITEGTTSYIEREIFNRPIRVAAGFNLNGLYVSETTLNVNGNVYLRAIADYDSEATLASTVHSNVIQVNSTNAGGNTTYDGHLVINDKNSSEKNIQIFGGIEIESSGNITNIANINMANSNSYWYGTFNSGAKFGTIGLSNGAKWVPVDYDSNREVTDVVNGSVGTLNLNEGGIVDISKYNMDDAPEEAIVEGVATGADRTAATNHQVSVSNLNGSNGLFKMDLNYLDETGAVYTGNKGNNDVSDYLDIQTGGEGTQYIDFNAKDANIDKMNIGDKIYFANVASGDTQFDSTQHVYSSAANINNYEYGVESEAGNGTDWYVTLNNKTPDGNGNFEAAKGAMYAGYALGTELDRLNKRMGEARYLEDEKGLWVRYRHAKTGWDDTFETSSDMFQLGYNKEVQEDDGKHYRGIALDYTDADTTLDNVSGDGEHERYAVSLYDTWLGEKGHYRDLLIRGGRINSDYDLRGMFDGGMYDIGGDYHQWFGSISAEWGRKNDMNDGWYFEPQTQLQLARVGGASYVSDSGIAVDQDGATSLIGRVGFRLGREYAKADGTKHDNYYIKADLLHEFMGDKGIALTGADGRYEHEYDGQETWFDVGLGADISIDKDTYFWVDVEKTLGSDFDNTWQVNGGFRWEF